MNRFGMLLVDLSPVAAASVSDVFFIIVIFRKLLQQHCLLTATQRRLLR